MRGYVRGTGQFMGRWGCRAHVHSRRIATPLIRLFSTLRATRPLAQHLVAVERPPALIGWLSSDAEEIERRRWCGRTEIGRIEVLELYAPYFGSFRVPSG